MVDASNYEYNFILYRETLVLSAISNDIIRRAMGVSRYRKTRLFLVKCSEEFCDHAKNYATTYDLEIYMVKFLREVKEILLKEGIDNQMIVTHTWPATLFSVVPIFQDRNLILIEEVPPLFDRLPSKIRDQGYLDRFLTTKAAIRMINSRYMKTVKAAKMYLSISDYEKIVLEKYYGLKPDGVVYEPVDDRYFEYTRSERKSLIIFGNPDRNAIRCIMNSVGTENIKEIIQVNSSLNLLEDFASGVKITEIHNYTFLEIQGLYRRAALSITDESRGSFELTPIESIMSGVPIISPAVPSIQIIKERINSSKPQSEGETYPYFDYLKLRYGCDNGKVLKELASWYSGIQSLRELFSRMCHELFSIDAVGIDFIRKVEQHFSYVSEK